MGGTDRKPASSTRLGSSLALLTLTVASPRGAPFVRSQTTDPGRTVTPCSTSSTLT